MEKVADKGNLLGHRPGVQGHPAVRQLFVRGRHGGVEKGGGWKTSRMTPLPKRGFGPPLVRCVFHPPQVSVLCFSCTKIHDRADQKLFWRGPKIFGRARSLVRFPPPYVLHPPISRPASWKFQKCNAIFSHVPLVQERKFSPKRKFLAGYPCGHPAKNFGQALQILEKKQAFRNGHPARTSMKKLRSEKLRADFPFPIGAPYV